MNALLLVVFLLTLAAMSGAELARPSDDAIADIATPRNFVSLIECSGLQEAEVQFIVPSAADLSNKFGRQPVEIWIDISLFNNNFSAHTFLGAGPFTARGDVSDQVYTWRGVIRDSQHYYRLNALFADGSWREIGRATFRTPDCAPLTLLFCELELSGRGNGNAAARFEVSQQSLGPERPVTEFWIDLSIFKNPQNLAFDNGFLPGTFIGAGPFPASGATFDWRGLLAATRHYSRINLLHGGPSQIGSPDQWAQTLTSRFTTLDCRDLPAMRPPTI